MRDPDRTVGAHMTLVRDTREYASWLWRATRRLAQVDRGAAMRLIASMSVNQVVTFLVFFLPLKVVLLVASDGVSRYFQFFITKDTKSAWIAGVTVAILVLYVVSIRLDTVADRNASRGAKSLIGSAEKVPITSDPENFAKSTVYRIGETVGGLIFSLLTLVAGALVFPAFFLSIPVLLLVEFAIIAIAVSDTHPSRLTRLGQFVSEKPLDFIKWLRQINFLIVFSFLILLFLAVEGLNPLLGIAAILLSRRLFGALKNVARDSLKLSSDRRLVDALLWPDARVRANVGTEREQLLERALPSGRLERIRGLARTPSGDELQWYTEHAATVEQLGCVEDVVWVDSGQSRTAMFDLYGPGVDGSRQRLFRDYLHSGKASRGLEQHDYLLRFLDSEALRCPARVVGYQQGALVGRVVDFRGVSEPAHKEWGARRAELLQHLWSLEVPASLIKAYDGAHPRVHERLRGELLTPLRVANDEPWTQSTYDLLAARLPWVCERVGELPVGLFNDRLTRRNVVAGPDGRSCLLDWTSWALLPVGAGFAPDSDGRELLEAAARSARARVQDGDGPFTLDVLLAAVLTRMDRLVLEGYPKTALQVASAMQPVLDQPQDAVVGEMFPERASHAPV